MTGAKSWDKNLAGYIDHTTLSPTTTDADVQLVCEEAAHYGFAAVVVPPVYVLPAVNALTALNVSTPVCSVVSFPLGFHSAPAKVDEAKRIIDSGATEVDMMMNVGAFLAGYHMAVRAEVESVVGACKGRALVKLIIETAYLDEPGIVAATKIGVESGVDFVKTSTGFAPRGASENDVTLIKSACSDRVGIKAAGGIRDRQCARRLIEAGAARLGCSASVQVVSLEGS
ncbi:MAG: deoxyribose-phosphate aldolase [bacterium]|nr:deoxyribose-phosphate aldolase [bacterium]